MPEYEERTEQATPRKRQRAKEKGQTARSREIISLAAMAGIILVFYFAGDAFLKSISVMTGKLLGLQCGKDPLAVMKLTATETMKMMAPFLGLTVTFALVSGVMQGGAPCPAAEH